MQIREEGWAVRSKGAQMNKEGRDLGMCRTAANAYLEIDSTAAATETPPLTFAWLRENSSRSQTTFGYEMRPICILRRVWGSQNLSLSGVAQDRQCCILARSGKMLCSAQQPIIIIIIITAYDCIFSGNTLIRIIL